METNNQDKNSSGNSSENSPENSSGKMGGNLPSEKPENGLKNSDTGAVSGMGIPAPTVSKLDLGTGDFNGSAGSKLPEKTPESAKSGLVDLKTTPAMLALNISKDELDKVGKETEGEGKYPLASADLSKKTPVEDVDFFKNAALDEKAGGSKLLDNVSAQKVNLSKPDMNKLLGSSKILEKTLEQEGLAKAKKRLGVLRVVFVALVVVALGANGFFFYQLNPSLSLAGLYDWKFESNLRSEIVTANQSLNSIQTLYNKYRYLTGNLYLSQFGFEATQLFDNVKALENPITVNQREPIEQSIANSKNVLSEMLVGAKENLVPSIVVKNYAVRGEDIADETILETKAQVDLKRAINEEKQNQQLENGTLPSDAMKREFNFIESTQELVGNDVLASSLSRKDPATLASEMDAYVSGSDPAASRSFENFVGNILEATKVDLAVISDLREARVVWSDVVDRIDEITRGVDRDHNAGNSNNSRTSYNNYSFTAMGHKVSVNGLNVTDSGTNRAVMTVLIEKFEASPDFKEASNRSFPLSKNTDENNRETFQMNFRLELTLEDGQFSLNNSPLVDLEGSSNESNTPVRRNPVTTPTNSATTDESTVLTPVSENAETATGIANTLINNTNNQE